MRVGTIKAIHRYPVKSLQGETLGRAHLGVQGIPGDRGWAVRNETRGGIQGAKQIADLMKCAARYLEEPKEGSVPAPEIRLPGGETFLAGDDEAGRRLSSAVDAEVTLWPIVPPELLDHYKRLPPEDPDADFEQGLRELFARNPDEPLPDLGKFPPELFQYETPPGTYFDAYPLLLLSQASLDQMSAAAPDSVFDVRRFRPNLLIDAAPGDTHPELAWEGRRLRVGGATLALEIQCPRCVMTTHGFDDLPKDPKVMRALVQETGGNLGLYARVETPGDVAVGDALELDA